MKVPNSKRGGVLLAVAILSAVGILLAGSILQLSLTERNLTVRNALYLESRNAAEALVEYGFAQIRQKFESRNVITLNPVGADALVLPPADFWRGSNVRTDSNNLELIGGNVEEVSSPDRTYYYIDPHNPNNENDPMRGKWVWRRDVSVLARATVSSSTGHDIVSYARQTISVRGAPLFAHAIFYNMDLEIAPGPDMHIYGPVHSNGDLYLLKQGTSGSLNFHGQVTASGHFYRGWKHGVAGSRGNETTGTGDIRFANSAGLLLGIKQDINEKDENGNDKLVGGKPVYVRTVWNDSLLWDGIGTRPTAPSPNFRSFASDTWEGNLLTASHGITDYRPIAIGEYLEADPANPSVAYEDRHKALADRRSPSNSGRLLIEPSNWPTDTTDPNYSTKKEVEAQKFSNHAGIYIRVQPPLVAGDAPVITATSRNAKNPSKNKTLILPPDLVRFHAFSSSRNEETIAQRRWRERIGSSWVWFRETTTTLTPITTNAFGSTALPSVTTVNREGPLLSQPTVLTTPQTRVTGSVTSGLFDQRRKLGVNLVDINMDALREAVGAMAEATAELSDGSKVLPDAADPIGNLQSSDWTGVVYIEVAGAPTTDPITGATITGSGLAANAANRTAVRVTNGKGRVPSYGETTAGLTLATNAPMYVHGHFNADGVTSTDAATNSASVYEPGELPAALVADAITFLSPSFNFAASETVLRPTTPADNHIEISAALLTGITPTNPTGGNGNSSGGAHNFPRFLENWDANKNTVFIRGSLVALFESRVATEPWHTAYYGAPGRRWGFNRLFEQGIFPPGTPSVTSYRRVNFEHLDSATYQTLKTALLGGG